MKRKWPRDKNGRYYTAWEMKHGAKKEKIPLICGDGCKEVSGRLLMSDEDTIEWYCGRTNYEPQ